MKPDLNYASLWRIEFAEELAEYYSSNDHIKMIVLGGSPVRGLSDAYSDLDVVVYWDKLDLSWIDANDTLAQIGGERRLMTVMKEENTCLEHYYFDTVKCDFAHLTLESWEQWANDVQNKYETTPWKLKTISGFLESEVLHGEQLAAAWKEKLAHYPDRLAHNIVQENLRIFVPGYLQHQALERGEILAYYDGLCQMTKKILTILAALNRIYYSAEEPRWIPFELDHMSIKPRNVWERVKAMFDGDRVEAISLLYELIYDVLDLVSAHMPAIDVATKRQRMHDLRVQACEHKPVLKGNKT
jgi:hypothetical protein